MNEKVPIRVMPSAVRATYAAHESQAVQGIVRGLLVESKTAYLRAHASIEEDADQRSVVAFLLRSETYTADVVRAVLRRRLEVVGIEWSERGSEPWAQPAPARADRVREYERAPLPDMVFGTPVPEIPTAEAAVRRAHAIATAAGFTSTMLLGRDATLANYKKYLAAPVKAFGNVGHGYTGGIVLDDGNLTASWFAGLGTTDLAKEVVYFNSCQVHNQPLQPSIIGAGARTFVGGIVNLLIGPSEEVFRCFWDKVLTAKEKMGPSLANCEKAKYPTTGAHGFSGDVEKF
jgi:hypothetical protein